MSPRVDLDTRVCSEQMSICGLFMSLLTIVSSQPLPHMARPSLRRRRAILVPGF